MQLESAQCLDLGGGDPVRLRKPRGTKHKIPPGILREVTLHHQDGGCDYNILSEKKNLTKGKIVITKNLTGGRKSLAKNIRGERQKRDLSTVSHVRVVTGVISKEYEKGDVQHNVVGGISKATPTKRRKEEKKVGTDRSRFGEGIHVC